MDGMTGVQASYRRGVATNGHQNIASGSSRRHTGDGVMPATGKKPLHIWTSCRMSPADIQNWQVLSVRVWQLWAAIEGEADTSWTSANRRDWPKAVCAADRHV